MTERKLLKEWLGTPQYVGLEIISDHKVWGTFLWSEYTKPMSESVFQEILRLCTIKWSFSKL